MRGVVLRVGDTGELRSTHHAATTTVEGSGAVDALSVERKHREKHEQTEHA